MEPASAADALAELLARLASGAGSAMHLTGDELSRWPVDAVRALHAARWLVPASPAASAVCPGCERACVMPVEVQRRPDGAQRAFMVCDKREDIGRVPVNLEVLARWRCGADTVAESLARSLGSAGAVKLAGESAAWRLGMVDGRPGRAVVVLREGQNGPAVELAGHRLDLAALVSVADGSLVFDRRPLQRCADKPVEGTGAGESPQQRRVRLKARVMALKTAGVKAFLKALAAEEGVTPSRLKQLLAEPKPAAPSWAGPLMGAAPRSGGGPKKRTR